MIAESPVQAEVLTDRLNPRQLLLFEIHDPEPVAAPWVVTEPSMPEEQPEIELSIGQNDVPF